MVWFFLLFFVRHLEIYPIFLNFVWTSYKKKVWKVVKSFKSSTAVRKRMNIKKK